MKTYAVILLLTTLSVHASAQTVERTMVHDGVMREYSVYVPIDYAPDQDWPLVVNLHASSSNRIQQQTFSNMSAVAE